MPKNKRRNKAQNINGSVNNNEENININGINAETNSNNDTDNTETTDSSVISGIPANFDPYDDEQTKAIVGSLFDEFVEEGGVNYFADYSDPFLDAENEDDEESLGDSISRRRKKSPISTDNGKVVFRKRVKKQEVEPEPDDNYDDTDEDEESSNGLDKTIILTTINKLFKKSSPSEDEEDYEESNDDSYANLDDTASDISSDDEIDDFFSSLKRDSSARVKAAAAKETAEPVHNASRDNVESEELSDDTASDENNITMPPRRRRSKNVFADIDSPYNTGIERHSSEADEDTDEDGYEVKVVSISPFTVVLTGLLVLAVIIVTVLAYSNHKFSKQLDEARTQITELQKSSSSTYETELEELKKQVADLTAENEQLKGGDSTADDPHAAAVEILNEAQNEVSTQEAVNTAISQGESSGNTYTVKAGDTPWKISQSVYGNGANYQKILDANGLTENSVLNEGQVLKIPN
jgi:LysM repeat protein